MALDRFVPVVWEAQRKSLSHPGKCRRRVPHRVQLVTSKYLCMGAYNWCGKRSDQSNGVRSG